jgi:lipoprotein-anchoring transpeptidase ErfK/SrfK
MESSIHNTSGNKFLPNITQVREAMKQLPDPEEWSDSIYISTITIDKKSTPVRFKRLKIQRGSKKTYRWTFEGKMLIRNRDIDED